MGDQPAFPQVIPDNFKLAEPGMSLRDWFAGQVLPKALDLSILLPGTGSPAPSAAKMAYEIADAMLAEREKSYEA